MTGHDRFAADAADFATFIRAAHPRLSAAQADTLRALCLPLFLGDEGPGTVRELAAVQDAAAAKAFAVQESSAGYETAFFALRQAARDELDQVLVPVPPDNSSTGDAIIDAIRDSATSGTPSRKKLAAVPPLPPQLLGFTGKTAPPTDCLQQWKTFIDHLDSESSEALWPFAGSLLGKAGVFGDGRP